MADQTFHTPNFGDEEFEIPPLSLPPPHDAHHGPMSYSMGMGHVGDQQGQHQHHYASMYMPEHMTHSPYGGSPPTYTTLSSPHAPSQSPHGNPHVAAMIHHQQQLGRPHMSGPPPGRSPTNSNSPGNEVGTSEDSNDSAPITQISSTMKRPSPEPINDSRAHPGPAASTAKKSKPQKKKKKRDPNEPQKPVSAYALFFRDTQAAIKGQNPNASFGEVSKIVASMWDALEVDHKNVYKKKTEAAKKEYLKALAAYRASLVSKGAPTESADGSGMYPPNFNATMNSAQQPPHYQQPNFYAAQQKKGPPNLGNGPSPMRSPPAHQMPSQNHSMIQQMSSHGMEYGVMRHPSSYLSQMSDGGHALGIGNGMHMPQPPQVGGHGQHVMSHDSHQAHVQSNGQVCVRNGCGNSAITSQEWDEEYCSSDCVVTHCRDVFTNWVSSNQSANSPYHPTGVNKFNGPGNAGLGSDGIPYVT